MKTDEVPQDNNRTLGGETKAVYAKDADGRYNPVASSGWQVEEVVTGYALDQFKQAVSAARERCRAGRSAVLEYHMYAARMDVQTLAETTGLAQWRVRRHMRPRVFARLKPALKQRYARALGLSLAQLDTLPVEESARGDG